MWCWWSGGWAGGVAPPYSGALQLRAWVLRHSKALAGHRLICTGGTGAMISEAVPGLEVQRLQRGARGGDQQLGALIATGELDGIIFFADPTVPHVGDVDLQALTRLAILHDTLSHSAPRRPT